MTTQPALPFQGRPVATPESLKPSGGRLRSVLVGVFDRLLGRRLGVESHRAGMARRLGRFDSSPSRIAGVVTEPSEQAPDNEAAVIPELMASLAEAKRVQPNSPPPYLPGADWKRLIDQGWAPYLDAVRSGDHDVVAAFARNFFRNEGLTGFWGDDRMFEIFDALDGPVALARAELMQRQFDTWREMFPDTPTSELAAPAVGNPWGYVVDGQLLYEPVCEYHYHAHYARRLLSDVAAPVVLEIGGGFGGLAYQLMRDGTDLTYIGLDLPEAVFLQAYYLATTLPHLKIKVFTSVEERVTAEVLDEYDVVLMPNFMLPQVEDGLVDLALNIRSLSEMPAETIAEYLAQLDRVSRLFVFHENIYKPRIGAQHGIPSSEFPDLESFVLVSESESRWPRYDRGSDYPCRENLYLHRSALGAARL